MHRNFLLILFVWLLFIFIHPVNAGKLPDWVKVKPLEPELMGELKDPVTGMEFVYVKGGCYEMGCGSWTSFCESDEYPVHTVCVDGFYIGKYEITQEQWEAVMGKNPSYFGNCGDDCPVEQVSWDDVQEFIRRLNRLTGQKYRLPTEAEWEYACRSGGKSEKYSGDNDLESVAWFYENSDGKTHPVGNKEPNGLGIYDMSGNVWEWVEDAYDKNAYSQHSHNNSSTFGSGRVNRGGGWNHARRDMRCSNREYYSSDSRISYLGFRLVRTP